MIFPNLITPSIIPSSNSNKRLRFSNNNTEYIIPCYYQYANKNNNNNRCVASAAVHLNLQGKKAPVPSLVTSKSFKSQLSPTFWNEFQHAATQILNGSLSSKSLIAKQHLQLQQQYKQQQQIQQQIANLKRINVNNSEFNTLNKIFKQQEARNDNPQIISNKFKDDYAKYINSNKIEIKKNILFQNIKSYKIISFHV